MEQENRIQLEHRLTQLEVAMGALRQDLRQELALVESRLSEQIALLNSEVRYIARNEQHLNKMLLGLIIGSLVVGIIIRLLGI